MILEARNDFIILRIVNAEAKVGEIIVAHIRKPGIQTGVVLSVGSGRADWEATGEMPCEAGDTVIYLKLTAHDFEPEYGVDLACVRAVDIVGVIAE